MLADTLLLLTRREMVEGYNTSAFCSNLLGSQQNYPFLYCNVICTKASIKNNRIFYNRGESMSLQLHRKNIRTGSHMTFATIPCYFCAIRTPN